MKTLNRLRYIFFALVILGCFANFAQNEYGLTMIFWAFTGIIAITLIELFKEIFSLAKIEKSKKFDSLFAVSEKLSLAALFILFLVKFHQSPSLINLSIVIAIQTGIIMIVWLKNSLIKYEVPVPKYIYHFGIFSFPTVPFGYYYFSFGSISPDIIFYVLLLTVSLFTVLTYWHYNFIGKQHYTNFWKYFFATRYFREFTGSDIFAFSIFVIVIGYIALWSIGIAPEITTGKYPPAYRTMLKENKKEQAEKFIEHYKTFLENRKNDNK